MVVCFIYYPAGFHLTDNKFKQVEFVVRLSWICAATGDMSRLGQIFISGWGGWCVRWRFYVVLSRRRMIGWLRSLPGHWIERGNITLVWMAPAFSRAWPAWYPVFQPKQTLTWHHWTLEGGMETRRLGDGYGWMEKPKVSKNISIGGPCVSNIILTFIFWYNLDIFGVGVDFRHVKLGYTELCGPGATTLVDNTLTAQWVLGIKMGPFLCVVTKMNMGDQNEHGGGSINQCWLSAWWFWFMPVHRLVFLVHADSSLGVFDPCRLFAWCFWFIWLFDDWGGCCINGR